MGETSEEAFGKSQNHTDSNTYKEDNANSNTYHPEDDEISIRHELSKDSHITIIEINTIEQMNTAELNMNPEMGDEDTEDHHESTNAPSNIVKAWVPGLQKEIAGILCCKMVNNQLS